MLTLIDITATARATIQSPQTSNIELESEAPVTVRVSDGVNDPEFPAYDAIFDIDIDADQITLNFANVSPDFTLGEDTFRRFYLDLDLSITEQFSSVSLNDASNLSPTLSTAGNTIEVEFGPGTVLGAGASVVIDVETVLSGNAISGRVFHDVNSDSTRNSNEEWLGGWVIELRNIDDPTTVVASTVSGDVDLNGDGFIDPIRESGAYLFQDIAPATYLVQEVPQAGFTETLPSTALQSTAFELDQQLNLRDTGNDFRNWGGFQERWVFGERSFTDLNSEDPSDGLPSWYYVTPDGSLFQWDGSPRTALTGTLIAQLNPRVHENLALLTDAPSPRQYIVDFDATEPAAFTNLDFGNVLNPVEFTITADEFTNELVIDWQGDPGLAYDIWISDIRANVQVRLLEDVVPGDEPTRVELPDGEYRIWMRTSTGLIDSLWTSPQVSELMRPPVDIITGGTADSIDATPTIQWSAVDGAESYAISVLDNTGAEFYSADDLPGLSHRIATELVLGQGYTVAVRVNFTDGSRTMFGEGRTLNVTGQPAVFVDQNNRIAWTAVNGATGYQLWIDRLDDDGEVLQSQVLFEQNLSETNFVLPNNLPAGNYSVWVRGFRQEAGTMHFGEWSERVRFTN
ncbi:MAG: hypothetical protein ABJZ55_24735 [Fuerstiella sp.]